VSRAAATPAGLSTWSTVWETNVSHRCRAGFTLLEVLMVVVILAIVAAAVVPKLRHSHEDSQAACALSNLRALRVNIELYRLHHLGRLPSDDLTELTIATDVTGAPGSDFGPYFPQVPLNPFTESRTVRSVSTAPPAASRAKDAGWLYHAGTGQVWLDHADYLDR
jgi:prepilin-type N-terminal cleavage/methylation domain-containing protein